MNRLRPARAAALVLALALPLGLVACSDADDSAEVIGEGSSTTETTEGSDGGSDESSTTTDGSEDPTSTTDGSDDPTTTTDGGGGGGQVSGELVDALLTADDLPPGHAQDGEDETDNGAMSDDEPLCDGGTGTFPTPIEEIERTLQTDDYSSLVGSFAGRFEGDDAEEGLAFYRSEIGRCDGTDAEYDYRYRDIPGIGDEAMEIILSDPADPASAFSVYFARVDDVLVGVTVLSDPELGIDGEDLIAISAGRL